jgi:hypothetical protein
MTTYSTNVLELSELEKRVILLIREKAYQTITVRIKDGKIVNIKIEESIDLDANSSRR